MEMGTMKRYQHIAHPGSIHRRDLSSATAILTRATRSHSITNFAASRASNLCRVCRRADHADGERRESNTHARRAFRENRRIHALHPEIGIFGAAINHAVASAKRIVRIASPRLIVSARKYL